MSKPRHHRQTKEARNPAAGGHDPLIMELVRLLARAAAERDYDRLHRSKAPDKTKVRQDG
jgi:hypothetical protein